MAAQLAVGDQVLVSSIGVTKEDLVLVAGLAVEPEDLTVSHLIYLVDDIADRDATFPTPDPETFVWVIDEQVLYTYTASAWQPIAGSPESLYLTDLADTDITTPGVGHILRYNGTQWVNLPYVHAVRAADTDTTLQAEVSGDTDPRIHIDAAGKLTWGSGSGAGDTVLYRGAASTLVTEDEFRSLRASAGLSALSTQVSGDSVNRLQVDADGTLRWGSGSGSADISLARGGAGFVQTDGYLRSFQSGVAAAFVGGISGDSVNRFAAYTDGKLEWGSGSATRDTNLYRSAANVLKTDDALTVAGAFSVGSGPVEIDPASAASGHILRHNGTKFVSVAEESNAQYPNATGIALSPGTSTTSTTYVNISGASFSFTKLKGTATKLRIELNLSWWINAGGTNIDFAVLVNGVDYQIAKSYSLNSTTRQASSGVIFVTGLAANTYTIQARWKTSAGTLSSDSNDYLTLDCMEVK